MAAVGLVGRDAEIAALDRLLGAVRDRGGAVLVRGEPGIGKSALLRLAREAAAERGLRVLSATGVESETTLPFAGLHQLVRPLLGRLPALPGPQRRALMAAFGMTDDPAPELFLIGLAALNLVSDSAADQPLVLVVDDAHWLDGPSADVLGFIARRLESEPVVLVAAQRDGFPPVLADPELEGQHLERLDRPSAEQVLAHRAPGLDKSGRSRLLDLAAGNPLALAELPLQGASDDDTSLTLTARLEHAFAARLPGLPDATRDLLLVAALEDDGALGESLAAAGALRGEQVSAHALVPAVEVGLVATDGVRLDFRHPLVRHAITQQATLPERQRAHAALAATLPEPDRQVWHRASAAVVPDESLAAELEEAGARARRRGGVAAAQAAVERAARLSADPAQRVRRYLRAAELAFEWGRPDVVDRLLQEADALDVPARERTRMAVIREWSEEGIQGAGTRRLTEVAVAAAAEGRTDQALLFLHAAALRCMWTRADPATRAGVLDVIERTLDPDDVLALEVMGYLAPLERRALLLERLRAQAAGGLDPERTNAAGSVAGHLCDLPLSVELLTSLVAGLRADGRFGRLGRVLMGQAWNAFFLGRFDLAATAADEAGRVAADSGQPLVRTVALVLQAAASALRGAEDVEEQLDEAARFGLQIHSEGLLAVVQVARGVVALDRGRHQEAWDALVGVADARLDPLLSSLTVGDLVEAAIQSGHRAEVEPLVADLEWIAARAPSPALHVGLRYARALLAPEDEAESLFAAALAADLTAWPFARAGCSWPTVPGCGGSAGRRSPVRRSGPHATPSTRWAPRAGASARARSCAPPGSRAGRGRPRRASS